MCTALERDFAKYMEPFAPLLLEGLKKTSEAGVCSICVGIVGDLVRAFEKDSLPYCDNFMGGLLTALQDPNIDRDVKPDILSCFGGKYGFFRNQFMAWVKILIN